MQVASYNAQGIIEYKEKEFVQETAQEFETRGVESYWKERTAKGFPIGSAEKQLEIEQKQWIGDQPSVVPIRDPVRDIVAPPYNSEQIDWKRFEKPMYPFASSEWEDKNRTRHAWVPGVEPFTNQKPTFTGIVKNGPTYASLDWSDKNYEAYSIK